MKNKKIRILFVSIYFLVSLLCFSGTIINMGISGHYNIKFEKKILPIYNCNNIFSDSKQNLYIESGEFSFIQVYDKKGIFKYRINIPTDSGGFDFYIDDEDFLKIRTYRNEKEFLIKDETLIDSKDANNKEFSEKYEYFCKIKRYDYRLNWKKNVVIYDGQNSKKEITLDKVYFPLSVVHYSGIIALGLLIIFSLYREEIISLRKKQRKAFKK